MRSLVVTITIGAVFFAASCGDDKPIASSITNAAPAPSLPTSNGASAAEAGDTSLIVSGPIIVDHQVELAAQRDGVVEKVLFDAPARVRSGTILAFLDGRQVEANLAAAQAKSRSIAADLKNWQSEAEVLQADYVRAQKMWDLGLISEEQLQHAKYKAQSDQFDIQRVEETLNTAHDEERSLELELEKTKITAPFDGLIARRYVHEGQAVNKGERLFWVTAEAPLLMRFTLPEKYFGHLLSMQQFEITSPDLPGEKHTARVKEVSPVIDPSSGTFEVLVELTDDRGSLRPGMTANLRVASNH